MPDIYDNIDSKLLPALQGRLAHAERADFCVGYFNLRGWRQIAEYIEPWAGGNGACVRLLVGMQALPQDELRQAFHPNPDALGIDQQEVVRLKRKAAEEFRQQLTWGAPSAADERGLRQLAHQLRDRKVIAKLFLRHRLHAKLYLIHRQDVVTPIMGILGSSNLTFAGLAQQGELNVDVADQDAARKLAQWFNDRWADKWCLDISDDLAEIIETSWAREIPVPPYYIYLKMAYHLSREAQAGLVEFSIPKEFRSQLFEFQEAAVKIAAHHLNKRGGVLIGDVVGLGKTLMATALARIFELDRGWETLIICPKNLVPMWEDYVNRYGLRGGEVLSIGKVQKRLPDLPRFRIVILDESHNLRNREGSRYKAIKDYIEKNDSHCILLTATPYNKTYLDLANQLRLFVPAESDLGVRPEKALAAIGELEFVRRHQCKLPTLAAFEHSEEPDDWRELMRLYMVRRTRSFIQENYTQADGDGRRYLPHRDGSKSYFPVRQPRTVGFPIHDSDPSDPYARLFADPVVDTINALRLPRYGLGNYVVAAPKPKPSPAEAVQIAALGRAGQRLMGFCRTNLFKRLESGGPAFIQSVERHILRNYIFLHALDHELDLPLGTQEAELLDARSNDEDAEATLPDQLEAEDSAAPTPTLIGNGSGALRSAADFQARAADVYGQYAGPFRKRFKWLRADLFTPHLTTDLRADAEALLGLLAQCGAWDAGRDTKLIALLNLLTHTHAHDKVLVFTQFADTARYLADQLTAQGVNRLALVTGESDNPTELAWRFSPVSNGRADRIPPGQELRVLVATDVLSEGQNLQDAAVVVNYDLPWAIIRLVQRAGRVDRIGQQAALIRCYSFLPAEGVERIIGLRRRVRQRLRQNAEVVGTDEAFFEDDTDEGAILNLYHEKAGILDGEADTEVDLASYAYQIWKNAIDRDPSVKAKVENLPPVVYSTRNWTGRPGRPPGSLVYTRTPAGNDSLAWMDETGHTVTGSQLAILQAAECEADTPAGCPNPHPLHHALVAQGLQEIGEVERNVGGQLGRPGGARFRTYERLQGYAAYLSRMGPIFSATQAAVEKAMDDLYRAPLLESAAETINRQIKSGINDDELADLVLRLRDDDRFCQRRDEDTGDVAAPQIICSLGLFPSHGH